MELTSQRLTCSGNSMVQGADIKALQRPCRVEPLQIPCRDDWRWGGSLASWSGTQVYQTWLRAPQGGCQTDCGSGGTVGSPFPWNMGAHSRYGRAEYRRYKEELSKLRERMLEITKAPSHGAAWCSATQHFAARRWCSWIAEWLPNRSAERRR